MKMSQAGMNEENPKEKQYNVCAFLASTPAVSPTHRMTSGHNNNGSNITIGSGHQLISPFIANSNTNATVCQQPKYRPKTAGHSGIHNLPLLSDGCFSPIDRMGGDNLIQTMNLSCNETVMENSRIKFDRNVVDPKNVLFPFPTPSCMRNFSWNKYESLLESLNILKCFSSFDKDTAFASQERKEQANSARGNKKVEVKAQEKNEFVFTKEMFACNNSEAFIQVTHFLFDLLDKTETSNRFRDSWPIYERKQESLYRRKALEWFKEIISNNPKFFSKSVRLEQLQGLIVNPFGDRFLRFIHSFVDFVMFKITQDEEYPEDPILQKPVFSGKPEISKRQGLILGARITNLAKQARSEQEKCIQEKLVSNLAFKKMERINEDFQSSLTLKQATVSKLMKVNVKHFPENGSELLANQAEFLKDTFKKIPFGDLWMAIEKIDTPLNDYVNTVWRNSLDSFGGNVERVLDFVARYSRLWLFLKSATQKSPQLEIKNLYIPWEFRDIQNPNVNDVLKWYSSIVNDCLVQLGDLALSQGTLMSQKKFLDSKLTVLRQKCEDISKIEGPNLASLKAQVEFEIKAVSIELENVNWSKFSALDDLPLSSMFDFSPARVVDKHKKTGFTPALSSYLPSVGGRSFTEFPKNSLAHPVNNSQLSDYGASFSKQLESTSGSNKVNPSENPNTELKPQYKLHVKGQDTCDSPVSHLPPKSSMDRSLMLQSRNLNRRRSSNKYRLSLPIAEDTEPSDGSKGGPTSNSHGNEFDQNINPNDDAQSGSDIEQRLSALLQSFTADLKQPLETSIVPRRNSRRSSSNFSFKDKSNEIITVHSKVAEDLEEKLGILDITLSYANFLDLSHESDASDS